MLALVEPFFIIKKPIPIRYENIKANDKRTLLKKIELNMERAINIKINKLYKPDKFKSWKRRQIKEVAVIKIKIFIKFKIKDKNKIKVGKPSNRFSLLKSILLIILKNVLKAKKHINSTLPALSLKLNKFKKEKNGRTKIFKILSTQEFDGEKSILFNIAINKKLKF